jgi:hypothetical protein
LSDLGLPRFYANGVNIAWGPYDVTVTFLEHDPTSLPEDQDGPHQPTSHSVAQVVMSLGHAKAMLPLFVKAIAAFEQRFGVIPAPGFDETSKD